MKSIAIIVVITLLGCQANPDNLQYEKNYLTGLEQSVKSKIPVLIHFTGYGLGYDEFIYDLIQSKEILEKLNTEFVTIQLYVDDKREIQIADTLNLHKINLTEGAKEQIKGARNIGRVNAIIETDLFKKNTQPLYAITDFKGNVLVEPFGYTSKDRKYFLDKLNEALGESKKRN